MSPGDLVCHCSRGPIRRLVWVGGGLNHPRLLLQAMQPGGVVETPMSPPLWVARDHIRPARPDEIAAGYAIPEQRPGYPIGGPHAS